MDKKSRDIPKVVRGSAPNNNKKSSRQPKTKAGRMLKKVSTLLLKIILSIGLILTITVCIVGTALTIYIMEFVDSPPTINLNNLKLNFTSVVYGIDDDKNTQEVWRLNSAENRVWVDLENIPKHMQDAVVYTEDERFYDHQGVDFKRTLAAVFNEIKNLVLPSGSESKFGGSTITQQLIKNINQDITTRTIDVKIKEIIQAMNLEKNFSKDQILECYLNYIGLHFNTNGVQAGANLYFNKDVSELTINESAALSVISKSPSAYNPISNPENNKKRRLYALDKLLEHGSITKEEHDKYYNEELVVAGQNSDGDVTTNKKVQNYFVDAVLEEVIADLSEKYDYSREFATQQITTGGYQIYTTMEISTQQTLEKYFEDEKTFAITNLAPEKVPEASMVIMDYDGNIRALVGGKGKKEIARGFNRATQATRPAGSTMKPLAVYTPAFEANLITWSTIMDDSPIIIMDKGKEREYPKNYNYKYDGKMTIIDALKVSKNTIPVKLVQILEPKTSFDFVYNTLGLKSLKPSGTTNDVTLDSLALGGGGTLLTELTAAFQIFGNGGSITEPKLYTKVLDADGKTVLDTTNRSSSRVISTETAYIMNKGLWSVVNDGGSGASAKMPNNIEVVGKTGTSDQRKDLIFVGCTPYYVAGIRYGNDDNTPIDNRVGDRQIRVWNSIMTDVHKGRNPAKFDLINNNILELTYCKISGMIATSSCPSTGKGYYSQENTPSICTIHGVTAPSNPVDNIDENIVE